MMQIQSPITSSERRWTKYLACRIKHGSPIKIRHADIRRTFASKGRGGERTDGADYRVERDLSVFHDVPARFPHAHLEQIRTTRATRFRSVLWPWNYEFRSSALRSAYRWDG